MSLILCIETGTDICSVGLARDGELVSLRESDEGRDHAKNVAVFVDELLRENGVAAEELSAIAVGMGPGSYTGLRIGASIAKGICYGLNISLIPVDTLQVLCACAQALAPELLQPGALLCPMLDARRMEVYTALYEVQGDAACLRLNDVQALIIDQNAFADQLSQRPVYFFGNGAEECKVVLSHPNAHFIDNIKAQAKHMVPLAEMALARGLVEDVAYYTPFYLKEFVPGKSKSLL